MEKIKDTIKNIPRASGVYLFRGENGKIIYVGKAVNLKNRVRSYFAKDDGLDIKTKELVKNIVGIEWIVTGSEVEALILESELIKRYKPKYNIVWRDDKNFVYIKISREDYPQITIVRQNIDDKAQYIGPFIDARAVREILHYLRKIFLYRNCVNLPQKVCLQYSIGNCIGPCQKLISKKEYNLNIRRIVRFMKGQTEDLEKNFRQEMKRSAALEDFERATIYRNRLYWLKKIKSVSLINESKKEAGTDKALSGLQDYLRLKKIPKRIECYDISNIFGKGAVGSMVVFKDGISSKNDYRRFEIRTVTAISDFGMLQEVFQRRFSNSKKSQKDISFSEFPDLVVVDGGKGQLSTVSKVLDDLGVKLDIIGLAKKKEEIFKMSRESGHKIFEKIVLDKNSESLYLLQRIRDEAHRFAITYHRSKRGVEMSRSNLDVIHGVGPKTKKKILRKYGSIDNIKAQSVEDLATLVGANLAKKIKESL